MMTPIMKGIAGSILALALVPDAWSQGDVAAPTARVRVACVGDSITQGHGVPAGQTYPERLGRLLGDRYEVRNFGEAGRTVLRSGDNSYWDTLSFVESTRYDPHIVVILLGTNDAAAKTWRDVPQFRRDYLDLVAQYRALPSRPAVFVARPCPMYEPARDVDRANLVDLVVPAIDGLPLENGVERIDVHGALASRSFFLADGVHPNAQGAQVVARVVMAAIATVSTARPATVVDGPPASAAPWVPPGTAPTDGVLGTTAGARPGRFRIGPVYLTPRIRIGNIGVDTNVLYTPTDRRADVMASGGPALEMVLPVVDDVQFLVSGGTNYLYFVRTSSQRRLVSDGRAELRARGVRTSVAVRGDYIETFARPSLEVDRRVASTEARAAVEFRRRLFGRVRLALEGTASSNEIAEGQEFLGADLHRTLSREALSALASIEYALTPRTRLRVRGRWEGARFPLDHTRDGDQVLAAAGIETDAGTLIAGHAEAGVHAHRHRATGQVERGSFYASVDATWRISRGLRVGGGYLRDMPYTAFVSDGAPILRQEVWRAHATLEPVRRLELRLTGARSNVRSAGPIRIELHPGDVVEARRRDEVYEAGADLGYRLHPRFRLGMNAVYAKRHSNFADLGVDGLLLGGTLVFTP